MYISSEIQLHGEPSPATIPTPTPTSRAVSLFAHQSFTVHRSLEKRRKRSKTHKNNSDDKQNIKNTNGQMNHK